MIDFTDLTKLDPARWYYDPQAGEQPIRFIEKYLDHFEAQHDGKRFRVSDEWKAIIRAFYGVKCKKTHRDRYRYLYVESGKGAGKTPMGAALGMYHLHVRAEASPLIESMAASYQQAEVLFNRAKVHAERNEELKRRTIVQQYRILAPARHAAWRVRSGSKTGKSGSAPSLLLIDELHEMKPQDGPQLGVLMGNLAKRHNSKCVILTNAGTDLATPCGEWHERSLAMIRGEREESDVLPVVWAADESDDISDPATWRKACPILDETVGEDEYRKAYGRTVGNKGEELNFRRLWLTQWTKSADQVFDPSDIAKCIVNEIPADAIARSVLYQGLDVGPVDDITATANVYADPEQDLIWIDVDNFIPKPAADQFEKANGVPYWKWREEGLITVIDAKTLTPAERVKIADKLKAGPKPELFCYDRYQASEIVTELEKAEWQCEPIASTVSGIGIAMQELQRRVKDHSIRIKANACTLWQLSNLGCKADAKGNALPMRVGGEHNNPRKIDAAMAILYAMSRACLYMMRGKEEKPFAMSQWDGNPFGFFSMKPSKASNE
jgi:phage terminase large subunit-like protein